MANTLAYYDTATFTAVKSFIVQAPEGEIHINSNEEGEYYVGLKFGVSL